ncbi:hypothetical protein JCM19233_5876 [Vibrio astriarenae]|uniref:Uncharacterized protein n=1 Tax=Vibrio astriarenae TaxID=1481923 RepID=A0A7Z2T1X9_9VIBR|nr:hypothetical protein [Vibrio astriarenae]QIA62737.1 hypothetical protein GT360_04070 [Vibrio astriarenae]GAL14864.1 hypothetical protein JCM19233_5876 [Vibrio sp. C7]
MKALIAAIITIAFSASVAASGYHKDCKMGASNGGVPYSVCMQDGANKKR